MKDSHEMFRNLRAPGIGAPMFRVSGPALVVEQCTAGIIGAFPALIARPLEELDVWLTRYSAEIRGATVTPPPVPAAARGTTVFASPTSRGAAIAERRTSASEPAANEPAANASVANESDGSEDVAAQQRRRPRIARWLPLTAPIGARVVETPDYGGYVRLADGTVWEIHLPD
jgi:nitronate monooxygenase